MFPKISLIALVIAGVLALSLGAIWFDGDQLFGVAAADSPHGDKTPANNKVKLNASESADSGGLVLISEMRNDQSYDAGYHEDSVHLRTWYGNIAAGETFTVIVPIYGPYPEWPENVGMIAFETNAWRNDGLDLRIVSPSGAVYPAQEVDNGFWSACVGAELLVTGIIKKLQSGDWQVVLTNTLEHTARGIYFQVNVNMHICGPVL